MIAIPDHRKMSILAHRYDSGPNSFLVHPDSRSLRKQRGRTEMGKYHKALWAMLAVTTAAAPAFAQDAPTVAKEKPKAGTMTGLPGAASASYARCVPADGTDPTKEAAGSGRDCPTAEAVEGKGRTYTGGRRNEDAPPAAEAAQAPGQPIKGVIVKGGGPNKPAQR
jgi:hypothetical protein